MQPIKSVYYDKETEEYIDVRLTIDKAVFSRDKTSIAILKKLGILDSKSKIGEYKMNMFLYQKHS